MSDTQLINTIDNINKLYQSSFFNFSATIVGIFTAILAASIGLQIWRDYKLNQYHKEKINQLEESLNSKLDSVDIKLKDLDDQINGYKRSAQLADIATLKAFQTSAKFNKANKDFSMAIFDFCQVVALYAERDLTTNEITLQVIHQNLQEIESILARLTASDVNDIPKKEINKILSALKKKYPNLTPIPGSTETIQSIVSEIKELSEKFPNEFMKYYDTK